MNSAVNYTVQTEIHADDYALSPSSDADVLALCKAGKLDGISIMPNMEVFDTAVKAFMAAKSTFPRDVRVAVHLNFMEGKCVAKKEDVSGLVDNDGYFTVSWMKLLLWNYNPFRRKRIKKQLTKEIIAQTDRCIASGIADAKALRFDSHQHPHAIPIVADALMDAIKQEGYKVSYIRIPRDPVRLYMKQGGGVRQIVAVKCAKVLDTLALLIKACKDDKAAFPRAQCFVRSVLLSSEEYGGAVCFCRRLSQFCVDGVAKPIYVYNNNSLRHSLMQDWE